MTMLDPKTESGQGRQLPYSDGQLYCILHTQQIGPTKEGVRGKQYASDEEVKTAVMMWFKYFYEVRIQALIRRWNIVIKRNGDHVKK